VFLRGMTRQIRSLLGGARIDGARGAHSPGPVCRVTIDLRRLPPSADPAAATALLRRAPGVLEVRMDTRRNRAIVLHDSRTSVAELWNWLLARSDPPPTTT
jgi:hypothetical protein